MREDLFAPAWARVDHAAELRARMAQLWNDYIEGHPFTPSLIGEGDGVYILRVWEDQPPPAELAVTTGEWLYNVRSALDYVVWATAAYESGRIPPPTEGQLQYPIYDSEDAWSRNLYRLKPLAEHHRSMLKVMQPFSSSLDANYLGWINHAASADVHAFGCSHRPSSLVGGRARCCRRNRLGRRRVRQPPLERRRELAQLRERAVIEFGARREHGVAVTARCRRHRAQPCRACPVQPPARTPPARARANRSNRPPAPAPPRRPAAPARATARGPARL